MFSILYILSFCCDYVKYSSINNLFQYEIYLLKKRSYDVNVSTTMKQHSCQCNL